MRPKSLKEQNQLMSPIPEGGGGGGTLVLMIITLLSKDLCNQIVSAQIKLQDDQTLFNPIHQQNDEIKLTQINLKGQTNCKKKCNGTFHENFKFQ